MVCELCAPRAAHEGWIRADAHVTGDAVARAGEGRRRILERLGRRRPGREEIEPLDESGDVEPESVPAAPLAPIAAELARGDRNVRAVPTGLEQRCAAAVELFNHSEHPRTVAGVARSLGSPEVSVRALPGHASLVFVVVAWELCWYRYEIDLAAGEAGVRNVGQGYELSELEPEDREVNAVAADDGKLSLAHA
jgi:hypothetical protein